MSEKKLDYQILRKELDGILDDLQGGELDIDEALTKYQRGQVIIKQLREFLSDAENKINKIKLQVAKEK